LEFKGTKEDGCPIIPDISATSGIDMSRLIFEHHLPPAGDAGFFWRLG
jgi:hypothetical protein